MPLKRVIQMKTLISSLLMLIFTLDGLYSCASHAETYQCLDLKIEATSESAALDKVCEYHKRMKSAVKKIEKAKEELEKSETPQDAETVEQGSFKWQSEL